MKGLLLKDFYNTSKLLVIYFCFSVVIPAGWCWCYHLEAAENDAAGQNSVLLVIVLIPVFLSFLADFLLMNSMILDEQNHYLLYALTTPVNRLTYLNSKYLYCFLTVGGCVLTSSLVTMTGLFLIGRTDLLLSLAGSMLFALGFGAFAGICIIAAGLKYNAVKAGSIMSICFSMTGILGLMSDKLHVSESAGQLLAKGGIWGIGGIVLLIFMGIAVVLFRKSRFWIMGKEL